MNNIQNTSFMAGDYSGDLAEIERKRKIAEALQGQSMQQTPTEVVNGWAVPQSPWQGVSKLAQALVGAKMQSGAKEEQKALSEKYQTDLADTLAKSTEARVGSPEIPMPSEDAGGGPGRPAQAPNTALSNALLMRHPMTQQLGLQGMQRDMLQQSVFGQPGGPPSAGGGPSGPGGAAPAGGGAMPSMMQIQKALLSGDPGMMKWGEAMLEASKGIAQRPGAPVVNPFTGAVIAQPTPNVPPGVQLNVGQGGSSASVVPGFAASQEALHSVPNPSAAPIKVPLSGGQEAQLTQPEYIKYQQTGQLPERYGQVAPTAAQQPVQVSGPAPAAGPQPAPAVAGAPKKASPLGVPGLTQSQEDVIRQEGQKAANTEAGKEFISEMRQNYAKLRDVPATLENIERAKALAAGEAAKFMGPFGESRLAITKFMRGNVPGMGNLKTDSVTSAEELQSTLFNQVMDNLKKMDASPSQYQQQVMQEAFGTLRSDPQSVPKILNVFSDILRNRVDLHNHTVKSAEGRGTVFPYDVNVKLPEKGGGGAAKLSPATLEFMRINGIQPP